MLERAHLEANISEKVHELDEQFTCQNVRSEVLVPWRWVIKPRGGVKKQHDLKIANNWVQWKNKTAIQMHVNMSLLYFMGEN